MTLATLLRAILLAVVAGLVVWWFNAVPLWLSLPGCVVVMAAVFLLLDDLGWFIEGYKPDWHTWWRR